MRYQKCILERNRYFRTVFVENTGICLETGPFFRFFTRLAAGLAVERETPRLPTYDTPFFSRFD
ncbi:hypothetical protein ACXZ1M_16075 [Duganella sp. PWIR1]